MTYDVVSFTHPASSGDSRLTPTPYNVTLRRGESCPSDPGGGAVQVSVQPDQRHPLRHPVAARVRRPRQRVWFQVPVTQLTRTFQIMGSPRCCVLLHIVANCCFSQLRPARFNLEIRSTFWVGLVVGRRASRIGESGYIVWAR